MNIYGFYQPTYYFMWVNYNSKSLKSDTPDINLKRTMLHETVHFIQDFSLYGLSYCDVRHQELRSIYAYYQSANKIELPVELKNILKHTDRINKNILDCVHNYNPHKIETIHKNDICNHEIRVDTYKRFNEYALDDEKTHFDYNDISYVEIANKLTKKGFRLGALDIMESMAHLIEYGVYPDGDEERKPYYQIPYNSAELVVEYTYPEFGINKSNVVALCDYALGTFNPGYVFYQALCILKDNKFIPDHPNEIYKCLQSGSFEGGYSRDEVYQCFAKKFLDNAKDFYSLFLSSTLEQYILSVAKIKSENKTAWADGLLLESNEAEDYYFDLINRIRKPFMIFLDTSAGDIKIMDEIKEKPYYLYGIFAMESILKCGEITHGEEKGCLLKKCKCLASNNNCDIHPWINDETKCVISNLWTLRKLPKKVL